MNPESLPSSTAGGRVLWSTKPAPLLVLARCGGSKNHNNRTTENTKQKPFTQNALQNRGKHAQGDVAHLAVGLVPKNRQVPSVIQ